MITRHRRRRSFLCASGAGQATGLQKHMYKYSPVENRWFQSLLWQHGLYPVAPPRGALVGLVPQTKLQAPPNWTMKHYKLLFFLLLMLFRSVCHQVSNQTNRWISSSGDYILISANVSPTYSSGLLQGNVFNHKTCSIPITRNNEQYDVQRQKTQSQPICYKNGDSVS